MLKMLLIRSRAISLVFVIGLILFGSLEIVLGGNILYGNDSLLLEGQYLLSSNCYYTFTLQTDGNLVVYTQGQPDYGSGTAGNAAPHPYHLKMQSDCNLVLYGNNNSPIWSSNTAGQGPNCYLKMQDDGNTVLYTGGNVAIFSTNSQVNTPGDYTCVIYTGSCPANSAGGFCVNNQCPCCKPYDPTYNNTNGICSCTPLQAPCNINSCGAHGNCIGGLCQCTGGYSGRSCSSPPVYTASSSSTASQNMMISSTSSTNPAYSPTGWVGTWSIDNTCSQTQCCCMTGNAGVSISGSQLIISSPASGQCGTSRSIVINVPLPTSNSFTTTINSQQYRITRTGTNLAVVNIVYPVCSGNALQISTIPPSNGNSKNAIPFSIMSIIMLFVAALFPSLMPI